VATDGDGDALYFDAAGLPEGLVIDHDTGEISGTLASSGAYIVTASASDGPAVSVVSFAWTVAAPFCGDDILDEGEECDDGNAEEGDGCSAACAIEEPPLPDGGLPDGGLPDGGLPDGGLPDGGTPGADGGVQSDGGGGCSVGRSRAPFAMGIVWLLLVVALLRRRAF
jgi:cysteine-rich repeat protein